MSRNAFNLLSILFLLSPYSILIPDTIRLKDGRAFENVKSRIEGNTIRIEAADGSIKSFPIENLKSIEPGEIKANQATSTRKHENSTKPSDPTPMKELNREEQTPSFHPVSGTLNDPISRYWIPFPFWSALNSAGKTDLGIPLSFAKGIGFLLAGLYLNEPESATTRREKLGQLLLVREYNQSGNESFLALALYRKNRFDDQVYTPLSDHAISREEYEERSRRSIGLFLAFVLLDGFFTFRESNLATPSGAGIPNLSKWNISPTIENLGTTISTGWKAELVFRF